MSLPNTSSRVRVYTGFMVAGNPSEELFEALRSEKIPHLVVTYRERCTCPELNVGFDSESRVRNPDCPEHGEAARR